MEAIKKLSFILIALLMCVACKKADIDSGSTSGVGGSTATFTISKDHLYTIVKDSVKVFDLSNAAKPVQVNSSYIGNNIETIFPYKNMLFFGATSGMYIYDITVPAKPVFVSLYQHLVSCDPVVADSNYAYITMRTTSNGRCGGRPNNVLEIVNISNPAIPAVVKQYPMYGPKGLGIDKKRLFVCDQGLKTYDVTDPFNIKMKEVFQIPANDVIPYDDVLMVIADDGLYQYDYSGAAITELSRIKFYE